MTQEQLAELLLSSGFVNGWALLGTELNLWEHDEDPPAPLERPKE